MHFYWMVVIVVIHYNYNFIIITFLTAHLVLTSGWNKSTLVTDLHLYTGQLATRHFTYVYITKEVPIARVCYSYRLTTYPLSSGIYQVESQGRIAFKID